MCCWRSTEIRRAQCTFPNVFTGNSIKMTAALLLPVLKSQPKSVNLSHKGLKKVPKAIGQLRNVLHLELQGNKIKTLPAEFGYLVQVSLLYIYDLMKAGESLSTPDSGPDSE